MLNFNLSAINSGSIVKPSLKECQFEQSIEVSLGAKYLYQWFLALRWVLHTCHCLDHNQTTMLEVLMCLVMNHLTMKWIWQIPGELELHWVQEWNVNSRNQLMRYHYAVIKPGLAIFIFRCSAIHCKINVSRIIKIIICLIFPTLSTMQV